MSSPLYSFYITQAQEEWLTNKYKQDVKEREELMRLQQEATGQIHKYTAKFYIRKEPIFLIKKRVARQSSSTSVNPYCVKFVKFLTSSTFDFEGNEDAQYGNSSTIQNTENMVRYCVDPDIVEKFHALLHEEEYGLVRVRVIDHEVSGLYYCSVGHALEVELFDEMVQIAGDCTKSTSYLKRQQVKLEVFEKYDLLCG